MSQLTVASKVDVYFYLLYINITHTCKTIQGKATIRSWEDVDLSELTQGDEVLQPNTPNLPAIF